MHVRVFKQHFFLQGWCGSFSHLSVWVCVPVHIQMYTVYRLQVTLCHAASPPASSVTEISTWWEGRTFLDQQDLGKGAGPAQCWRPGSCAAWERVQRLGPTPGHAEVTCGSLLGMMGLTEGRDLWLLGLKSNQASTLPLTSLCSTQAIALCSRQDALTLAGSWRSSMLTRVS